MSAVAATHSAPVRALAELLGAPILGSPDIIVTGVDTLDKAGPQTLSFVRDTRRLAEWRSSRCGAALVARDVASQVNPDDPGLAGRAIIVVDDPDLAMITLLKAITPAPHQAPGVHPAAIIDPTATIGEGVSVGPGVVVGPRAVIGAGVTLQANCYIGAAACVGDRTFFHPSVTLLDRCTIGADCIVHSGVVIGADGFGYRPAPGGKGLIKIPHAGTVEIGSQVEIGANTCIDRGKFGPTVIGDGTKIDNLVQIAHNCRIGRCCIICGHSALAGSVVLGDGVTVAGGVGVADNRTVGAGATLAARAAVMDNVPAGETWFGYPARPFRHAMRTVSALDHLLDWMPVLRRKLREGKGL